ncbi:unnamed protein product (macronuclear) [Paramecium tetraurelia]|uniref:C3H1-type domain-containing protein n=1 Tax=Paramecium tetraurelia TaxID=5888 RepID=A0DQS3_PARTE|nr:uncharacterized protein GSPATT00002790001 [Paramecium tetraurelia]CAK85390.1 unnamed protein product [Paramecium tetraurelia]|eukprot:XP_001452787.1 hypothetical protein (macronuclear) [Paramecium tetraurelia strain d4-2]
MSKKSEKKKQEKIIEDRTFGLKNKNKSKQVQNFCKGVAQQVKHSGVSLSKLQSEEYERKKIERQLEEEDRLMQSLYKTVEKVKEEESEEEVDPKSILCEYYKQGLCQKGKKCMYSHDMSLEQKTAMLDLYTDQREQMGDEWDSCQNWDEKTLKDIVEANEKTYKSQIPSAKVCDYFLDALEKGKYGWRWVCPNGMTCHYKHCLPQGYVFRKKEESKQKQEGDLEEEIDEQISQLQKGGTKITKEVFEKWKQERAEKKKLEAEKQKIEEQKKKGAKQTGGNSQMTGRALFVYDPSLFIDDDEAEKDYERVEQIDENDEEDEQENKQQLYEGEDNQQQDEDVDQQFKQQQQ